MPTTKRKQIKNTAELQEVVRTAGLKVQQDSDIPGIDSRGWLVLGGQGAAGSLMIDNPKGDIESSLNTAGLELFRDLKLRASLRSDGRLLLGGNGTAGSVELLDKNGKPVAVVRSEPADLRLGGEGHHGYVSLLDAEGRQTVHLNGAAGQLTLGDDGSDGDLKIRDRRKRDVFVVDGDQAAVRVGDQGNPGKLGLVNREGNQTVALDANAGQLILGDTGSDGDLKIRDGGGSDVFVVDGHQAAVDVGGQGNPGKLYLRDGGGSKTVTLDGEKGDISFANADCAEEFPAADGEGLAPGTVVVLDGEGLMRASEAPYDRRVAGVVSGEGDLKPAIVLGRNGGAGNRVPVALVGQVHCQADADPGAIEVGDLLVTSPTAGHAMAAHDPQRAFGAVIGKAIEPLARGHGRIRILVSLQ